MNRTYTHTIAAQTDALIASGKGVRLFQIIVNGDGGAGRATIELNGTTTVFTVVQAVSGATQVVNFGDEGILFANGIQVTTAATTLCTLVHSPARTS